MPNNQLIVDLTGSVSPPELPRPTVAALIAPRRRLRDGSVSTVVSTSSSGPSRSNSVSGSVTGSVSGRSVASMNTRSRKSATPAERRSAGGNALMAPPAAPVARQRRAESRISTRSGASQQGGVRRAGSSSGVSDADGPPVIPAPRLNTRAQAHGVTHPDPTSLAAPPTRYIPPRRSTNTLPSTRSVTSIPDEDDADSDDSLKVVIPVRRPNGNNSAHAGRESTNERTRSGRVIPVFVLSDEEGEAEIGIDGAVASGSGGGNGVQGGTGPPASNVRRSSNEQAREAGLGDEGNMEQNNSHANGGRLGARSGSRVTSVGTAPRLKRLRSGIVVDLGEEDEDDIEGDIAPIRQVKKQKVDKGKAKAQVVPEEPEDNFLASFQCPICLSPPLQAVLTPCGHILCGACLFGALKAQAIRENRKPLAVGAAPPKPPGPRRGRFVTLPAMPANKGRILTGNCPVCRHDIDGGMSDRAGEGGVRYLEIKAVMEL